MLVLLTRVVSIVTTLLGLVQQVLGFVSTAAQEHTAYAIETIASNAANTVNSPTFGNAALLTKLIAVQADLDASVASLTLQIVHLTDGATPVSLPSAPAGYGGLDAGDTAIAVWNVSDSGWATGTMGDDLLKIQQNVFGLSRLNAQIQQLAPDFYLTGPFDLPSGSIASDAPVAILLNVLAGDTALSYLEREDPAHFWISDSTFGGHTWAIASPETQFIWIFRFSDAEFPGVVRNILNVSTPTGPGFWPGLAKVTLGTPVALSVGLTITTPMNGVIVTLTAEPAKSGFFTFDDVLSWRNLGAISFFSDNGDQEPPQSLGFTSEVYAPTAMSLAAGVKVRTVGGVTGTVTPWVAV